MKRPKIAVVVRTVGLEYDDRVRKECISLSKIADVRLFVTFENNDKKEGITSYGIPYKSFRLTTRERLSSGKFLLVKAMEFYLLARRYLKDFDLIWAHEEYTFLFPLFTRSKFIWDLHEIPERFDQPLLKKVFHFIEIKSKQILHANRHRIEYLIKKGIIRQPNKHDFIRNYPDKSFVYSLEKAQNFEAFQKWLGGSAYVYLQGISSPDRYPFNCIASILKGTPYKVIVVGPYIDDQVSDALQEDFGESYRKRVFFTGMVNQLSTPAYLSKAVFSMVFYDTNTPNMRFCEANRFYQSLVLGVPVITGMNEPMAEILKKYDCGICMETDGRAIREILEAISMLIGNYNYYKSNCINYGKNFIWNDEFIRKDWLIKSLADY